jgi:hypothetical protein
MRTDRPVAKIELSAEVASILEGYMQRRKTAQALALRARIVPGCAAGLTNKAVVARERVTAQTVRKWRQRFAERGLDGQLDEPRPSASSSRPTTPTPSRSSGPNLPMPSCHPTNHRAYCSGALAIRAATC